MSEKVTHIGQGSLGATFRLPESFVRIGTVLGCTVDLTKDPVSFSFRRTKRDGVWGWAIHLHVGRLEIWAPWVADLPFPRRRIDAERWVVQFAKQHGIKPMKNIEREVFLKRMRELDEKARADAEVKARRAALRVVRGGDDDHQPERLE